MSELHSHDPRETGISPFGTAANGNGFGAPAELHAGTGLGKYRILERIRACPAAIVYKARDNMLDRLVAIKQMAPQLTDDPRACGNFRREAQLLARVAPDARHVIAVHELIEDNHGLFIVHEYVDAHWLETLIRKRQLSAEATLQVFATTALGLRSLHAVRIVHRNLCPTKILVAPKLGAKIADLSSGAPEGDFGIPPFLVTRYAAPELYAGEYDDRVDIYALGFLLFEMCVGRSAFHKLFAEVLKDPRIAPDRWRQWHEDYDRTLPPASELNPLVPAAIVDLIRRMTAKNVDERFASIDEVILAVSTFLKARRTFAENRLPPAAPMRVVESTPYVSLPASKPAAAVAAPTIAALPALAPPYTTALALRGLSQTTRQKVKVGDTTRQALPEMRRAIEQGDPFDRVPYSQQPALRRRLRAQTVLQSRRKPMPKAIPKVEAVEEKPRIRFTRGMAIAAVLALAIALPSGWGLGRSLLETARINRSIRSTLDAAREARRARDYAGAIQQYESIVAMRGDRGRLPQLREEARWSTALTEAERLLERDALDDAEGRVADAAAMGAAQAEVSEIRRRIETCRRLHALSTEFDALQASGDFDRAEEVLSQYERTAEEGHVAAVLRERLASSKARQQQAEKLSKVRAAVEKDDYASARIALSEAKGLLDNDDAREAERYLDMRKSRYEWLLRGDAALYEKNYEAAAKAFDEANQLSPSRDVEGKSRFARAFVLLHEAEEELNHGDLSAAEQKFKHSLWNYRLDKVEDQLRRLAPAFDAARIVAQADRAVHVDDFEGAVRLYREALPKLPRQAALRVEAKLSDAEREAVQRRGEAAYHRGDWAGAVRAYEELIKLQPDDKVRERLDYFRTKLKEFQPASRN